MFSILIVEDDVCTGQAMTKLCRAGGYSAALAATGAAALQQIQHAPPDVIILDYMLPDMTGMDVLLQVRSAGDSHPIIIYTALNEPGLREKFLLAGATDFWQKTEMTAPQILSDLEARFARSALISPLAPESDSSLTAHM
jgi:CheY-like chemotaxis protein